jgi:hypothetical protein
MSKWKALTILYFLLLVVSLAWQILALATARDTMHFGGIIITMTIFYGLIEGVGGYFLTFAVIKSASRLVVAIRSSKTVDVIGYSLIVIAGGIASLCLIVSAFLPQGTARVFEFLVNLLPQ